MLGCRSGTPGHRILISIALSLLIGLSCAASSQNSFGGLVARAVIPVLAAIAGASVASTSSAVSGNDPAFVNGMNASLVIGQPSFTAEGGAIENGQTDMGDPEGVAFDKNGDLWVADRLFSRVLEFKPPFGNGMKASIVIGYPNFVTTIISDHPTTATFTSQPRFSLILRGICGYRTRASTESWNSSRHFRTECEPRWNSIVPAITLAKT